MNEEQDATYQLAQAQSHHYASSGPTMDNYNSNIVLLTSTSPELYELKLTLLNMTEDENGDIIPIADGAKPLLSDEGVAAIVGLVGGVVKRSAMLNNWSDQQIYNVIMKLYDDLWDDLTFNRLKYRIKDIHIKRRIIAQCIYTSYICMQRGYNEGERKFHSKITHELISKTNRESQRQGLWSKLKNQLGG